MEGSYSEKRRILFYILAMFSSALAVFFYFAYANTVESLEQLDAQQGEGIDRLYAKSVSIMLERSLHVRQEAFPKIVPQERFVELVERHDTRGLYALLEPYYRILQDEVEGFHVMNVIDAGGTVLVRMHQKHEYGDDLVSKRPQIRDLVANPRDTSFFEVGEYGLFYRHVSPIYTNDGLIGFIEMGLRPSVVIERIDEVFGLKGYVFIENATFGVVKREGLRAGNYTLCPYCSPRDHFIESVLDRLRFDRSGYEISEAGHRYRVRFKPIRDGFGNEIGKILFFRDTTLLQIRLERLLLEGGAIFAVLMLFVFLLFERYTRRMFERLSKAEYIINNINDSIIVIDPPTGRIIDANERAETMLGYTRNELLSKNVGEIRRGFDAHDSSMAWNDRVALLRRDRFMAAKTYSLRKDGTTIPIEASLNYIESEGREFIISVGRDISRQLEQEARIRNTNSELKRLNALISRNVPYLTTDLAGTVTFVSEAYERLFGYSAELMRQKQHNLFHDVVMGNDFYTRIWSQLQNGERCEAEIKSRRKDGGIYWAQATFEPIYDEAGGKIGYASYREDISVKKELEYTSLHDRLTALPNRYAFEQQLETRLKSASRYGLHFGFIIFDIDHFKNVNDSFGHHVGDEVLQTLASTLHKIVREDDTLARWGGEEFVLITMDTTREGLVELTRKMQIAMAAASFDPVEKITLSFGITLYHEGDTKATILRRADEALYRAKANGRNRYEVAE